MFATCPKCNRGLTVKELVTDSHRCALEKPSSRVANRAKRSARIPHSRKYIKDNFDTLVAAALKNS